MNSKKGKTKGKKKQQPPQIPVFVKKAPEILAEEWKLCLFPPDFRIKVTGAPYSATYRNESITDIYSFWASYDRAVILDMIAREQQKKLAAEKLKLEELKKRAKKYR